jgi:hypothetical protein
MRFRIDPKPPVDKTDWHTWFAWYPVRIKSHLVWLERVSRRGKFFDDSCGGCWSYEYETLVVYYY